MPTINGVKPRPSDDTTGFVHDRRRPGRVPTDNPHLIAMMRGEALQDAEIVPIPSSRVGRTLLWIFVLCLGFWAAAAFSVGLL